MQYYDQDGIPVDATVAGVQYYDQDGIPVDSNPVEAPKKASAPVIGEKVIELANQEGPKPFKYILTAKDGFKTSGEFPRLLTEAELAELAQLMGLGEGFTVEQSISSSPDEIAQYLAQQGGTPEDAYGMPRTARTAVEELGGAEVPLMRKGAAITGDIASGAGRLLASGVGEAADYLTGSDSESFASRLSRTGANPDQNIGVKILEDLVRDPSVPVTMGGAGLISKAKYVPGVGDYLSTQALSTPIKQVGLGALTGTGAVAVTDALNDYALNEDRITPTDYALGGLGGSLMPSVQKGVKELAMSIKPNAPSELARINILPETPRGPLSEEIIRVADSPELMDQVLPFVNSPAAKQLKFVDLIQGKLKNADAQQAEQISMLTRDKVAEVGNIDEAAVFNDLLLSKQKYGPSAGSLESVIDRASYKYPEYAQRVLDATYNPLATAYQKAGYPVRKGLFDIQENLREKAGTMAGIASSTKMPYLGMIGTDLAEGHYQEKPQEPVNFVELMNQRYLDRGK